ncbi:bicaudal C homolog 2 [Girardinichthys multiradiatus]|uniref:bicaudal C homolog 2 n=1 Tax=Girardinichthys multiradiatus TaxID=208333 RepID=UPI001FAE61B1|nr:bicaudal C homolog 2 [Girardinichthys multiradiatus]
MHKHQQGLSPATATTIMEKSSSVSLDIAGPQQPELETSLQLDTAAKTDPRQEKEDEGEEKEGESCAGEDAKGQSLDPEWVEERFRIDRKKLEAMLYAPEETGETGEKFFQRVMRETSTQVKWPSKLKIGAKSKKDPHVKVEGKRTNVMEAKRKILEVLETKLSKVSLKMDVAFTEHSHVIGKGGGNIKKVMEVTCCHIHFPDSNRHNAAGEKSNQVSIAGPIEGVEEARRRIRALQPLSLSFELPVSLVPQALPDAGSPLIQQVAQTLGVSVSFRAVPPLPQAQSPFYGSSCTVWGLQGNAAAVKKAICILMELLLGSEATRGMVSSQLDVTAQQHLFLLGQNGANFLRVMHKTQTQIILPDLTAPQSPPSLLIQGTPDGVCLARQQLMDCLPVCLMFDMREDGEGDPFKLAQMMQNLGVFISVKPKVKQTSKSVVVKGLEKNISCIYEARSLLLQLNSCETATITTVNPDLMSPGSGLANCWLDSLLQQLRFSEQGSASPQTKEVLTGTKPHPSPPPGLISPTDEGRTGPKGTDSRQLEKILENEYQSDQSEEESVEVVGRSPSEVCEAVNNNISRVGLNGRRGSLQSPEISKLHSQGRRHSTGQALTYRLLNTETEAGGSERRNSLRRDVSRAQNVHADSSKAKDYDYEKKKLLATRAMQRKPVVTEVRTPTDTWSGLGFSKSMPAEAIKELRSISRRSYKPYLSANTNQQQCWAAQMGKACIGSDSENWRDRRGSTSQLVSSSSPSSSSPSSPSTPPPSFPPSKASFSAFSSSVNRSRNDKSLENYAGGCFFEGVCSTRRESTCSQWSSPPLMMDDLPELLSQLGLIKYIDLFEQQEIDYQTFLTLSDEDLKEVGVSTFGARRKMLLAISDLNKSKRRLSDAQPVNPGYLEGGASGRLPHILDVDVAAQSNCW